MSTAYACFLNVHLRKGYLLFSWDVDFRLPPEQCPGLSTGVWDLQSASPQILLYFTQPYFLPRSQL